jgi:hypothetical protein
MFSSSFVSFNCFFSFYFRIWWSLSCNKPMRVQNHFKVGQWQFLRGFLLYTSHSSYFRNLKNRNIYVRNFRTKSNRVLSEVLEKLGMIRKKILDSEYLSTKNQRRSKRNGSMEWANLPVAAASCFCWNSLSKTVLAKPWKLTGGSGLSKTALLNAAWRSLSFTNSLPSYLTWDGIHIISNSNPFHNRLLQF